MPSDVPARRLRPLLTMAVTEVAIFGVFAASLDILLTILVFPTGASSPVGFAHLLVDCTRYWILFGIPVAGVAVGLLLLVNRLAPSLLSRLRPYSLLSLALSIAVGVCLAMTLHALPDRSLFEFYGLLYLFDASSLALSFLTAFGLKSLSEKYEPQIQRKAPLLLSPSLWRGLGPPLVLAAGVVLVHTVVAPVYKHRVAAVLGATSLLVALFIRLTKSGKLQEKNTVSISVCAIPILLLSWPLSQNKHSRFVLHGHVATTGAYATFWRAFTDLDHDGATAWYLGGSDCDPANSNRSPMHKEIPGDGIDQDCVGGDAERNIQAPRTRLLRSCGSDEPKNILLVTVDALRADAITPEVMPHLHRLSLHVHRFDRAYPPSGSTAGTTLSMMMGTPLSDLNPRSLFFDEKLEEKENLSQKLKAQGYRTSVFFPFAIHPALTRGADFRSLPWGDVHSGPTKAVHRVASMSRAALDFLLNPIPKEPAFVWMHVPDMHAPYQVLDKTSKLTPYQQGAASVDASLGALFQKIVQAGKWNDTLVIVSSDHGEQLGQRGREGHGTLFFEEGIRVPLLVSAPNCPKKTQNEPVSLTAISDLALRYAGRKSIEPDHAEPFPAIVEEAQLTALGLKRAIIGHRHKLIFDLQNGGELGFDLKHDPEELENLSTSEQLSPLRKKYQQWLNSPGQR